MTSTTSKLLLTTVFAAFLLDKNLNKCHAGRFGYVVKDMSCWKMQKVMCRETHQGKWKYKWPILPALTVEVSRNSLVRSDRYVRFVGLITLRKISICHSNKNLSIYSNFSINR